jgi:methionyl-tRNA synthetase
VLQVDLGSEQRQICAGIRNHYTPEELIGKQIIVVANLETAKLRGLESQGMLLAASDEDRVIILTPDKPVQPGSQVS